MKHKPTYQTWQDMKQRCLNPRCQNYANYGGRGIKICRRWMVFENFLTDMGERPVGLTLERKNNDGGYSKRNCRWATRAEQRRNQRTCRHLSFKGERLTSDLVGLAQATILWRRSHGWTVEEIFTKPNRRKGWK